MNFKENNRVFPWTIGMFVFTTFLGKDTGTIVSTAVGTVASLVFGEITPEFLAKHLSERFVCAAAYLCSCAFTFFRRSLRFSSVGRR